jgi:predicted aldo/keto reductase-like oxidoreductase
MVHTLPFGATQVPVPGYGAMGLSFGLGTNLSLEEAEPVLLKALELGCTFWDTAVRSSRGGVRALSCAGLGQREMKADGLSKGRLSRRRE